MISLRSHSNFLRHYYRKNRYKLQKMDFEKILLDYFEGRLVDKDKAKLLKAIKEDKSLRKQFYELKLIWDNSGINQNAAIADTEKEWQKVAGQISSEIEHKQKLERIRPFKVLLKYAAIFIAGIGLTYAAFYFTGRSSGTNSLTENEIIVDKGQKSKVILSDGTKIWLNSETVLRYPSKFNSDGSRDVYLEGEAYFEVAKVNHQIFNVKTRNLNITVLGTSFNVKCYPKDKTIETTLIEGSVRLLKTGKIGDTDHEVVLKPNQKAVLNKSDNKIIISDLKVPSELPTKADNQKQKFPRNIESAISWKDQVLVFDNESLADIVVKLERWYGYTIIVKDPELLSQCYKGRFENYETIYQVLDAIKLTTPINYSVNNKTITIALSKK